MFKADFKDVLFPKHKIQISVQKHQVPLKKMLIFIPGFFLKTPPYPNLPGHQGFNSTFLLFNFLYIINTNFLQPI